MGTIKLWHWDDHYDPEAATLYQRGYFEGRRAECEHLLAGIINELQSQATIDVLLRLKGQLAQLHEDRNVRPVNQKGR